MELVNDEFWLGYAKRKIEEGLTALNQAAANLSTLIGTFWGIYTLLFTAGTALIEIKVSREILYMLTTPIALLIAAYCFAQWAQLPVVSRGTDPRIPRQVELLYKRTVRIKTFRLLIASITTFLAAGMITISLILSNLLTSKGASGEKVYIAFDENGVKANVVVSGELPENSIVWVDIQKPSDQIKGENNVEAIPRYHTIVTNSNRFDYATLIVPLPDSISVTVHWKEKAGATTIYTMTKSFPEN